MWRPPFMAGIQPYAASRYAPIPRTQLISGFQLVKIWATTYKLLILKDRNRRPTRLVEPLVLGCRTPLCTQVS
jgi:hypothetical protein